MASISSNRPAVAKALFGLSQTFNLRRRVGARNRMLGDLLIDVTAEAIEQRSVVGQKDPSGNPWARLRPFTVARKARLGFDPRINIETYKMLTLPQIRGQTAVTSHSAQMTAGLDEETKFKVQEAHEGGPNRKKRPFYELGADGELVVEALLEDVANRSVEEAYSA